MDTLRNGSAQAVPGAMLEQAEAWDHGPPPWWDHRISTMGMLSPLRKSPLPNLPQENMAQMFKRSRAGTQPTNKAV